MHIMIPDEGYFEQSFIIDIEQCRAITRKVNFLQNICNRHPHPAYEGEA